VAESDSILILNVALLHEGSISFSYTLSPLREEEEREEQEEDTMLDGLQFFINGEAQGDTNGMVYHPENDVWHFPSFNLKHSNKGETPYEFQWVYHQPFGSRQRNRIILSDIVVVGDKRGSAFDAVPCQRGTFSSGKGTYCEPCEIGQYANRPGMSSCHPCPDKFFTNQLGTPECERCGKGTNSSIDRTRCDLSECTFWDAERNALFDLSSLQKHIFFEDVDFRYELSICDLVKKTTTRECYDENKNLFKSYSCAVNRSNGVAQDTGRVANVHYLTDEYREPALMIEYDRGTPCGIRDQKAHTKVNFICDLGVYEPDEFKLVSKTPCTTHLEWRSVHACRECIPFSDDYLAQNSKCEDNKQTVSYVKVKRCYGPVVMEGETVSCSDVAVTFPILFFSIVVLIGLVGLIVVTLYRNRRLAEQYEQMVNDSQRQSGAST